MTRSADLYRAGLRVMPGANTRSTLYVAPQPPYAARGDGCRVTDEDGHVVIDLHSNYTSLVHGHRHPRIIEAATAALADGVCFGLPTRHDVALASALCERMPTLERVRFTNSGTEAVMMAVRTARVVTGRDGVLRFRGSYHGSAEAALGDDAPGLPVATRADLVTVPQADPDAFSDALARDGERLACVVIDLMPNRAGLVPLPDAFAALVRDETRARGILLVVDEVITARMGVAGLHARYRLEPDLVTLGKIIGGGFAVGAFGGRAEVMSVLDPRGDHALPHAGTFSANPVAMRAGLVAMDLLSAGAISRINTLGDALRQRIAQLGYVVSGSGSLLRLIEVEGNPDLWWRIYRAGVLVGTNGLCSVSTAMGEAESEQVVGALAAARA